MKVYAIADDDLDGITSARLVTLAHNVMRSQDPTVEFNLKFQTWARFGLSPEDLVNLEQLLTREKYDSFYLLDLGSDEQILGGLRGIQDRLKKKGQVVKMFVFDNHPPDDFAPLLAKYQKEDFLISSSQQSCTAGLLFAYFKDLYSLEPKILKWAEIYAILGLYGDVATEGEIGKITFQALKEKHPEMFQTVVVWEKDQNKEKVVLDMVAKHFHNLRRVLFDKGPPLGLMMMSELEKIDDVLALLQPQSEDSMKTYTAIAEVKTVTGDWQRHWIECLRNSIIFSCKKYTFVVVNHKWDVSSSLASWKASEFKKTCFVLNYGTPGHPHIGVRNPNTGIRLDVRDFNTAVSVASKGMLSGGGLHEAGSITVNDRNMTAGTIINLFNSVVDNIKLLPQKPQANSVFGDLVDIEQQR
jgi:hypothetical protein